MSDQPKMLMPNRAEELARRYLINKGYYDKESVPTREVYAMLIEYTAAVQQLLDYHTQEAMKLINCMSVPTTYIIPKEKE